MPASNSIKPNPAKPESPSQEVGAPASRSRSGRWWVLIASLAVGLLLLAYYFAPSVKEVQRTIEVNAEYWASLVRSNPLLTIAAFMLVYAGVTATGLPIAAPLSIAGGLIGTLAFGRLAGTLIATGAVVLAVTFGSLLLFMLAQRLLKDSFRARAGAWLERLQSGFQRDAFLYLLSLRLTPVPLFIQNTVPGLLGVGKGTFFFASLLGYIPGTLVYVWLGTSLAPLVESGAEISFASVRGLLWPLLALAALILLPIIVRRVSK